jgi:hypothetical protein
VPDQGAILPNLQICNGNRPVHLNGRAEAAVRLMSKFLGEPSRLTAKMNRERLARVEREAIMEEEAKKADAIRANMARLRELRLEKKGQEVRTKISTSNQTKKTNPKR